MAKIDKKKVKLIAGIFAALAFTNGVLLYLYPKSFSAFAYIFFIFVPLIAVVLLIFARFSFLFLKRIDEQEEEENLLRERQKEIVENMVEGLVVHDGGGKILNVNKMAENFLGAQAEDLRGKKIGEVSNASQLLRALFMPLRDGEESEFSSKDERGQDVFYQIIQVPLSEKRGEILKIIRDISRAKYLDKMKDEYITIISHKFLTPLTNIKWAAGIVAGKDADEAKKQASVNNIMDNTKKLIDLTSRLLNITETEEGLFGYKFEKVDMTEVAQDAIKNCQQELREHNLKMSFDNSPKGLYLVKGDKRRLATAVANYLDNAIKYSPDGGSIEASLHQDKYTLWFSVKDNGVGVSSGAIGSLFTKFFRDKNAKAVHTEGTGVGLFIVKNIIAKHGGKVGYEPNKKSGSMFYFTLPVYPVTKKTT